VSESRTPLRRLHTPYSLELGSKQVWNKGPESDIRHSLR